MRIAVIESTPEVAGPTLSALSAQGHKVLPFADANEALAHIEADHAIDAVIASTQINPASREQLCRDVCRLAGDERPIYVLLMSPGDDETAKTAALDCGADGVIAESPQPNELCEALRIAERTLALKRELIRSITMDRLSGLMCRAAFLNEVTSACREVGSREALAVVAIDIDSFRAVNDHYGHAIGDQAIRAVADVLRECGAPVGRLGGDEFGVLLREHDLDAAVKAAEDLHGALADVKLEAADWVIHVTCSLGVGEFRADDSVDDLIKRADLALYRAKQEGRDRVATTPSDSWMSRRPRLGVSLARLLPKPSPNVKDRRKGAPPGAPLYARVFAVIDLLVSSGLNEEVAAQILAQKLVLAGVSAPDGVEQQDWWRDILDRRAAFRSGSATDQSLQEYQNVVAAIETIAPHERVECVLTNDLWDRRRMVAGERPAERGYLIQ